MYSYFKAYVLILLLALAWPAASARSMSQEESEHARSAFYFAQRREWNDALLHAKRSEDDALVSLIAWQYILDADSGATFGEITRFIADHPDWPEQKKLRLRAEIALRERPLEDSELVVWFTDQTPMTGVGKIALANALMDQPNPQADRITSLVREAWRDGDFEETEENTILAAHRGLLRDEDDIARIDRLLWEEKTSPAKRILNRVDTAHQALFRARMTLIDNKKTAVLAVNQVPVSLRKDPGLLYDRMRYRAKRKDDKGVREMLLAAPKEVPYPEKWWRTREMQIRKSIDEKNYKTAEKLLANHGQSDGTGLADAIWLNGWLNLEFLHQPKTAYNLFYRMYNDVRYPVSRARGAFWAARAAERSGDKNTAGNWYNTAAAYPTTFYGQLASLKVNGTAPLRIPAEPHVSDSAASRFANSKLGRAIKLAVAMDSPELASKLVALLIENASDTEEAVLVAGFGSRIGQPWLSVRGAKKALQQNVVLIRHGYPTPPTGDTSIERALALAITRQESEFNPFARSPAGAVGMMQLLPSTARENARKLGVGYSSDQLYDTDYNIMLGSHYLSRLIDGYSGSYILAAAAYNAGPGNVRNWISQFGTPGNDVDDAIDWIEKIPFAETRNYVQRIMENLQVYRAIEADGGSPKLLLGEDLTR